MTENYIPQFGWNNYLRKKKYIAFIQRVIIQELGNMNLDRSG